MDDDREIGYDDHDEEDQDDSEESDDDIEIVLDTASAPKASDPESRSQQGPLVNIKTSQAAKDGENQAAAQTQSTTASKAAIDLDAVGQYNDKEIFDVDLDSFEDKPWRKPGADITDYFNFGFNESTWREYCMKQKRMREELLMQKKINVFEYKNDQFNNDAFGGMDAVMPPTGKYQRMQMRPQYMPIGPMGPMGMGGMGSMGGMGMGMGGGGMMRPGGDFNAFGKRMREQDDAVINVTSTASQERGMEPSGFYDMQRPVMQQQYRGPMRPDDNRYSMERDSPTGDAIPLGGGGDEPARRPSLGNAGGRDDRQFNEIEQEEYGDRREWMRYDGRRR
ncbi:cleavage polyadenylation factor subunit fip1 [Chytridiales sp. JEL 0842]|nr:cleavage polyadenylation factor subunit fip1 [Chytridiales sp. JEL 0842]